MKLTTLALAVMAGVLGGALVIMTDAMIKHDESPAQQLTEAGVDANVAEVAGEPVASFPPAVDAGDSEDEDMNQILIEMMCEE